MGTCGRPNSGHCGKDCITEGKHLREATPIPKVILAHSLLNFIPQADGPMVREGRAERLREGIREREGEGGHQDRECEGDHQGREGVLQGKRSITAEKVYFLSPLSTSFLLETSPNLSKCYWEE